MTVRVARIGACLAAAAAVVMGVSACGAGQVTQTADTVTAIAGADLQIGDLMLNNVQVAWNGPDGYAAGDSANLVLRIFNNGAEADRLTAVTIEPGPGAKSDEQSPGAQGIVYVPNATVPNGSASASTAPSPGASAATGANGGSSAINVTILPHGYAMLVPEQGPHLQINKLSDALGPAESVWLTFTFENAGTLRAEVPVGQPLEPVDRKTVEFPTGE